MLPVDVVAIHNGTFHVWPERDAAGTTHVARLGTIFPFRSRVVLLCWSHPTLYLDPHYFSIERERASEQRAEKCYI